MVEGAFGKAFGGRVHPAEIAKGLVSRMGESETVRLRSTTVANHYRVRLSSGDHVAIQGIAVGLRTEFSDLLRSTAETENWGLVGPMEVELLADPALSEGGMVIDPVCTVGDEGARVYRGGSFEMESEDCRSARRFWEESSFQDPTIGFRPVFNPPAE